MLNLMQFLSFFVKLREMFHLEIGLIYNNSISVALVDRKRLIHEQKMIKMSQIVQKTLQAVKTS